MTTMQAQPGTNGQHTNGAAQRENGLAKKFSFQPTAPIGDAVGLKGLLETMKGSIAQALPKHVTPERIIKTLLVAANRNPGLLKCTQSSILETINRAAELGLDLSGTLGEAYPVPFNNKIKVPNGNGGMVEKWVDQCTLIIGYRGFEKLAWQSGEVSMIDAEVVYSNDHFKFKKGFDPVLEWEPCMDGERGEPIGAYACLITKNGGKMARFMPKSDIEKIRLAAKSKDSPAWKHHWDEMARKTVLRRVLKDAPLSTEKLVSAMEQDDKDFALTNVLEANTLGSLPAGRSSFREQLPEDGEQTEQPQGEQEQPPEGDEGVTGDVVKAGTATTAPDSKPAAQPEAARPATTPVQKTPRERWPVTTKNTPKAPGYWRAQLLASAKRWCGEFATDAKGNDFTDMVNRLEDGHHEAVAFIPGPDFAKDEKAQAEVVTRYQNARAFVEASPDGWLKFVVAANAA